MAGGWTSGSSPELGRAPASAKERRQKLAEAFPEDRLIVPAGSPRSRSGDSTYRFRPSSGFTYLTGWGAAADPHSVLVLELDAEGQCAAVVYVQPPTGPGADDFYLDSNRGEYYAGRRPTIPELATHLDVEVRSLKAFPDGLTKPPRGKTRVLHNCDPAVEAIVMAQRSWESEEEDHELAKADHELATAIDELRLEKDVWEIEQLTAAIAATMRGYEDVVRAIPEALQHPRGERVIEAAFSSRARIDGNDVGFGTTAASGNRATTLHWELCDGQIRPGELLLVDAGVEVESLYTGDLTRTLPVSGRFSPAQRKVYDAVLDAADAAIAASEVGRQFQDPHEAAVSVLAQRLEEWGILPVSAEESLADEGQQHRRWMPHATSHHLGLDDHDCAAARPQFYRGGVIRPGMVFTIEPGLYFKEDDELVPPEFRGIGVRIEDDILATSEGPVNLSADLPRTADDVEQWMARALGQS
jgi:Xaa-Pro aminopeptidase